MFTLVGCNLVHSLVDKLTLLDYPMKSIPGYEHDIEAHFETAANNWSRVMLEDAATQMVCLLKAWRCRGI